MSAPDRTAMLDRAHAGLSIRRQCRLLGLARSNVYRPASATDTDELVIMRRLDELFLAWPFFGSRRMMAMLRAEGQRINRKRVRRLMRLMGLAALGPRPQTSKPAPGHKIYPYLLRGLVIEQANQVWAADITYVPIGRGFLYLVAIMDWASRAVLAWRLSNTLDADVCVRALEEALARFGAPEIFNTDQGSQFTSTAFTWLRRRLSCCFSELSASLLPQHLLPQPGSSSSLSRSWCLATPGCFPLRCCLAISSPRRSRPARSRWSS